MAVNIINIVKRKTILLNAVAQEWLRFIGSF